MKFTHRVVIRFNKNQPWSVIGRGTIKSLFWMKDLVKQWKGNGAECKIQIRRVQ